MAWPWLSWRVIVRSEEVITSMAAMKRSEMMATPKKHQTSARPYVTAQGGVE
jgi:hypothetical protein